MPRPHVYWVVLLLLVLLLLLIMLLVLMLILMMLPSVLKDAHLDALIQQHLLSHAVMCAIWKLECRWPRWRPVLLLTMHPVSRALIWRVHRVRCVPGTAPVLAAILGSPPSACRM